MDKPTIFDDYFHTTNGRPDLPAEHPCNIPDNLLLGLIDHLFGVPHKRMPRKLKKKLKK